MKAARHFSSEENQQDAMKLATMLHKLAHLRQPTIARVHGAALGGRLGLASACDICIASEKQCLQPLKYVWDWLPLPSVPM